MKAHFVMFAAYNAWANRRLYDAAARLSDETRKSETGAFFGSLHNTLAHLVLADHLWLSRLREGGHVPAALKNVDDAEFETLRRFRIEADAALADWVAGLSARALERSHTHHLASLPRAVTQPLSETLAHLFNHQTHHRGQCHHMLTQLGTDAPPLDLICYHHEMSQAHFQSP